MIEDRDPPAEPPVTEDIGLPTPPSPGRLPPPHLPPASPKKNDASTDKATQGPSDA